MNLTEEEKSGTGIINLTDSLNAPLLELKIYDNATTVIPLTNDLIIYVDKEETLTAERKQYVFILDNVLRYYNNVGDEFIIKSDFQGDNVVMTAYIKRLIGVDGNGNYLLENEVIEEIPYQTISLFEGANYIYTNYTNASIELVYPKNNDLNNRFLSNVIYNEHILNEDSLDNLYFKDCFTESEDGININANNLNIDCITSKQNNFSLDSDGNLSVNSVTSVQGITYELDYDEIFDLVYPVDSIYLSTNSANPSILFGGTWVEWGSGRVPVGVDSTQTEFNSVEKNGGHKELQSHNHTQAGHNHSGTTSWHGGHGHIGRYRRYNTLTPNETVGTDLARTRNAGGYLSTDSVTHDDSGGQHDHTYTTSTSTPTINNTGGGDAGNLPPYITCYMWKRVL